MLENVATTTSQVSRPRRTTVARIIVAIGPLLMLAGLLVILWPEAPSDCHGGPECSLDGLAMLGKLIMGGGLGLAGLMWLSIAMAATSVHAAVSTVRHGQSSCHH
jgi:hypothetical protein